MFTENVLSRTMSVGSVQIVHDISHLYPMTDMSSNIDLGRHRFRLRPELLQAMMCKSKSGLGLDLDLSPIFIENGLDLDLT